MLGVLNATQQGEEVAGVITGPRHAGGQYENFSSFPWEQQGVKDFNLEVPDWKDLVFLVSQLTPKVFREFSPWAVWKSSIFLHCESFGNAVETNSCSLSCLTESGSAQAPLLPRQDQGDAYTDFGAPFLYISLLFRCSTLQTTAVSPGSNSNPCFSASDSAALWLAVWKGRPGWKLGGMYNVPQEFSFFPG